MADRHRHRQDQAVAAGIAQGVAGLADHGMGDLGIVARELFRVLPVGLVGVHQRGDAERDAIDATQPALEAAFLAGRRQGLALHQAAGADQLPAVGDQFARDLEQAQAGAGGGDQAAHQRTRLACHDVGVDL
ncbi:MAG: hypothetical protein O2825_17235, partial [Proteobacteria bacterium]|nr:hypothetical protein [Pseudomonadota bacterium]